MSAGMAMWPDDTEHGAPIDAAIADAARQMTAGAPGGDLKARVLARIGEREPFFGGRRIVWRMVPIAAALIIALVVVGRFGGSRNRTVDEQTTQPQSTSATSAAQSQKRQTPTSVRPKPDTTYARDGSRRRSGGNRAPRAASSDVDALAPALLDVESIRIAALPPADSIGVAPLEAIEPIAVEPLATSEIDDAQRRER